MNFLKIKKEGVHTLVENEVSENSWIEFKKQINFSTEDEKREFLYDVSAFANSQGGIIYFGIEEKNGIAKKILGIENAELDKIQQKIENLLRDSISPRIPNLLFERIEIIGSSKSVLALIIPNSFQSPHMVIYRSVNKFYGRNSSGKYLLDVNEIGRLFLKKRNLNNNMDDLIFKRIEQIVNGKTFLPINLTSAILFIHVFPMSLADLENNFIEIEKYREQAGKLKLASEYHHDSSYNYNGIVNYNKLNNIWTSYLQIFRTGLIESYDTDLFNSSYKTIPSSNFESKIIRHIKAIDEFLVSIEQSRPFVIKISILNISDYTIGIPNNRYWHHKPALINEKNLMFPSIVLNEGDNIESKLKLIFDMLWNATGFPHSYNYDNDGNWTGDMVN